MSSTEHDPKHVIILGAGASVTSGYPVANDLRLLMSSERFLREALHKNGIDPRTVTHVSGVQTNYIHAVVEEMLGGEAKGAIELFRHGGFATIDEFSFLARSTFPRAIEQLKLILRFALALHDPEEKFHESDYYFFIQKLFQKGLFPLRNDIAILTFNYDPYLPYLLQKAYEIRCRTLHKHSDSNSIDAITGGFTSRNLGPLEHGNELCVLQLHGSIAWPRKNNGETTISYDDIFGTTLDSRLKKLCFSHGRFLNSPIFFPWEIMDQGKFHDENTFSFKEEGNGACRRQGGYTGDITVHKLVPAIWRRAQREITRATKISFVGLSMHEFLTPAFRFLFANKKDDALIVCANKDHQKFSGTGTDRRAEIQVSPLSPTYKLRKLLQQVCPTVTGVPSYSAGEPDGVSSPLVRIRESFRDFIENEMD